jgi:hypothetical protein
LEVQVAQEPLQASSVFFFAGTSWQEAPGFLSVQVSQDPLQDFALSGTSCFTGAALLGQVAQLAGWAAFAAPQVPGHSWASAGLEDRSKATVARQTRYSRAISTLFMTFLLNAFA